MLSNPVIEALLNRKSVRKYTEQVPSDEVVETVVRAGQQAPFAYQLGSLLLSRERAHNPFKAPLFFIICVDSHRHEAVMDRRGWKVVQNDLSLLSIGKEWRSQRERRFRFSRRRVLSRQASAGGTTR